MKGKVILNTTRLCLREFTLEDAQFIIELANSPKWIEFIGDKNIRTEAESKDYITESLQQSYSTNGFGLWRVELAETKVPVGMCGLVNRDTLEDIDIGFAMLPDYYGKGYGFEAASATMDYAKHILKLKKVVGITDFENVASIYLLKKIGLRFEKTMALNAEDKVLVFTSEKLSEEEKVIDKMTASFFKVFNNIAGQKPALEKIWKLFIPEGMIISNTDGKPKIYNLENFIAPRELMLNDGTLTNFSERELWSKTQIFGNIAQRFCFYTKSGELNGKTFVTKGMKTLQFIRIGEKWKISSVAWSDEV